MSATAGRPTIPPTGRGCRGITLAGEPCKKRPIPGEPWCLMHHPDREEERRALSSKGGKAATRRHPANLEVQEIKDGLRALARGLLSGGVAPGVGAAYVQAMNALLRAVETERKVWEQDEIEERLEALEGGGDARAA